MQAIVRTLAAAAAITLSVPATAQLQPWRDYTVSDTVSSVTTVKVHANRIDDYLEGIRRTWAASNEVARQLGHIQSYNVYVSDLPNSGEFNVLLVVRFANTADLAPNRARYEAFMQRWGEQNRDAARRTTTTVYPSIRDITGEYLMREVTFLPERR